MLDLNLIKTKPEYVSAALKKKGWDVDFTSTIEKMDKRLELIQKVEVVKAEINKLSASVPVVKKNGGDVQEIFAKVKELKPDKLASVAKYNMFQNIMSDKLNENVKITKNKIEIYFDGDQDLERILKLLDIKVEDE